MKDRYFFKKEKIANLLFDLVKYLITALGAIVIFAEKPISAVKVLLVAVTAICLLIIAALLTPFKEE